MKIAFLGTGKMGAPMALRLLQAGHSLTVWNRTSAHCSPLTTLGARLAATPAEAVQGVDAVCTMLFDDAAHEAVLFGPQGLLEALPEAAVHISHSTISVALSERLTEEHSHRNRLFVGAPVFGRPNVAETGKLWIVAAGAEEAIERAHPVFAPISRGISIVGTEPRQAHAVKIGGNFLISSMIYSLSESFVYAEAQGVEPSVFLETVNSALFQSPFYAAYSSVMLHPPAIPGATMELGAKDTDLFRQAALSRDIQLSLAESLAELFAEAKSLGRSQQDWAAGIYGMAKLHAAKHSSTTATAHPDAE